MTEYQKYQELAESIGRHERIFVFRGVEDPAGGWYRKPHGDPDHGGSIPMLRTFFINPKQQRERLHDLAQNGWFLYEPQEPPQAVKRAAPKVEEAPEEEPTPKTSRRKAKSK